MQNQLSDLQNQPSYKRPTNNGSRPVKSEFSNDGYAIPQSQMESPIEYSVSPSQQQTNSLDNSAIDPSLLPSPRQTQQTTPQLQAASYLAPDPNLNLSSGMYGNSYGDLDFPLQGMDFLQTGGGIPGIGGGNGTQGMAADLENQGGLDLGFGLGWDGTDHDFSEGNQLDLFDGFFFGGGSSGNY